MAKRQRVMWVVAETAYQAYGDALGWRHPLVGIELPSWSALTHAEQDAWLAAFEAVAGEMIDEAIEEVRDAVTDALEVALHQLR
jgi:hypothetical protein